MAVLGGNRSAAVRSAAELARRYAEPHRRYHTLAHVEAVLHEAGQLAEACRLDETARAVVVLAACCHDVVYGGRPGADEAASGEWGRRELAAAGVPEAATARVVALVQATGTHVAPAADVSAHVLLDADLAVLGAEPAAYDAYAAAVRAEYRHLGPAQWRRGRAAVLAGLLQRDPLYQTELARRRWEARARDNLRREMAALTGAPVDSEPI